MIGKIRHSRYTKLLWALMGFYLLNISVDTADPNPQHIPEDLSFNDQESIIEIIVEKVLGFENAIEEYDDADSEDYNNKKNVKIDLVVHSGKTSIYSHHHPIAKKKPFTDFDTRLTSGFKQIDSPPPKS